MKSTKIAVLFAAAGLSASAFATNGYFADGYGMKANGMAGVGIALPQDSLAGATNPAGMVEVGDRLDAGLTWFKPTRGADITGNGAGLTGSYDGNGQSNFLIPEFGYNKMLGWDMAVGVTVTGNGGMNTHYNTSPFAAGALGAFGGTNPAGVNLVQMFVAPTFSMKVNKDNSVGVSLVYGYQAFGATGLQAFAPMSSNPAALTNNGYSHSTGWGLRFGWTGHVSDDVTLGATYATKMNMSSFGQYAGLFADQGKFDIPENYGVGIAVKATPKLTIAGDIQQINYGSIPAIANTLNAACLLPPAFGGTGTCPLGANNGAGFGWSDMTVYKLGVSYEYSGDLTLRAGFSTNHQPVSSGQTFFNILAPGVVEDQLSLGATWTLANKNEVTVAYMHAIDKTVNGPSAIPAALGGGAANIHMYQDSLGIAYGLKFK